MSHWQNWLKAGLKKPGKSQIGLANHLGVDASIVSKLAKGTRGFQVEEILKIADYLEEPLPLSNKRNAGQPPRSAEIVVRAIMWEGAWREGTVTALPRKPSRATIPAYPSVKYSPECQYALELGDELPDAANKSVSQRFVVCVPFEMLDRKLRTNDWVHFEQKKGGFTQEMVRAVTEVDGTLMLNSVLPDQLEPIPVQDVEMLGIVIGDYTHRVI